MNHRPWVQAPLGTPCSCSSVAERWTSNPVVAGSNPVKSSPFLMNNDIFCYFINNLYFVLFFNLIYFSLNYRSGNRYV